MDGLRDRRRSHKFWGQRLWRGHRPRFDLRLRMERRGGRLTRQVDELYVRTRRSAGQGENVHRTQPDAEQQSCRHQAVRRHGERSRAQEAVPVW